MGYMHMATPQVSKPMEPEDLRPADEQILDKLQEGRATKGALVDWTGFSRNTIYNRLEVLEAAGHVSCIHDGTRLFELINDPRESNN